LFDSSALLALLHDEPGADAVEPLVPRAAMSVVNYAEVLIVLRRGGLSEALAVGIVERLALRLVPGDPAIARGAADVVAASRAHGLSNGDAFCLATARELNLPVVTADRTWAKMRLGVKITVVR
jgi:PIN domain nuclease of toxin-antitoxin system